jgi:hypothetical protein
MNRAESRRRMARFSRQGSLEEKAEKHRLAVVATAWVARELGGRPLDDAACVVLPSGGLVYVNARSPSAYKRLPGLVMGRQGYLGEDFAVVVLVGGDDQVTPVGWVDREEYARHVRAEVSMHDYEFERVWPDDLHPGLPGQAPPPSLLEVLVIEAPCRRHPVTPRPECGTCQA